MSDERMRPGLNGFTLIELMVVVAVTAVFATIALPSFTYLTSSHQAKAVSTDLYVTLTKARSEAVKRNANVTVSPNASSWQNGWQILDASSNVIDSYPAAKGVTITGGPASVVYQSSGRISGTSAPSFLVTGSGSSPVQRCVLISTSGRPYVKNVAC